MNIWRSFLQWFSPTSQGRIPTLQPEQVQWQPPTGGDGGIFWGGARIPKRIDAHFLVLGTTRSGKTTTLRLWMQDALADIRDPTLNTRALLNNPKREIHGILEGLRLGDLAITLDPRDARGYALDLTSMIRDHEGAKQFAATIVQPRKAQDGTGYFESALRALVESVIVGLIDRHEQTGHRWSLRTVLNILEDERLIRVIAGRHHQGQKDIESFFDGRAETAQDLRGVIRNYLSDYWIIANLWHYAEMEGRLFSIDEWLTSNRILILPSPPVNQSSDARDAVSQLNRLIFGYIADRLLLQPEARTVGTPQRTWIVLDEFRFAGELPGLLHLFTQGASKGVRVVIGAQNLSGLQDALGKERAEEFLDLCSVKAFFRAGNRATAQVMADHYGSVREKVTQKSRGSDGETVTETEQDRPVLLDSDFLNLPLPTFDFATGTCTNLIGYYRTAGVGSQFESFRSELPMERLYGPQGALRPVIPGLDFRPRPKEQQKPIPFTDEELRDLGLTPSGGETARSSLPLRRLPVGSTKDLFVNRNDDQ